MNGESKSVQRVYLTITLLSTLAASFIWGINTLFLLDAGLSNLEAFAANAFFTAGMVIFEVPTGVIADTWGRRASFLLGTVTLLITTLAYLLLWYWEAPFWQWAIVSLLIGLGFTFFSGAVEAWLVDALKFSKYSGGLEQVFAKGQVIGGIAMLGGSVVGGFVAQFTNLGVPYILRVIMLGLSFIVAFWLMKDIGFTPHKGSNFTREMGKIFKASIDNGIKKRNVRWIMLTAPFTFGVGAYAFYAMQPYLLELYGNPEAYGVAGVAAAVVAGAQIVGGLSVGLIRKIFSLRTNVLITGVIVSSVALVLVGLTTSFLVAIAMLVIWALVFAATGPMRQAYLNGIIPSEQRATVLSFDSLIGSTGAVFVQPALGRVADVYSYSASFVVGGIIWLGALPFAVLAKKEKSPSDPIKTSDQATGKLK